MPGPRAALGRGEFDGKRMLERRRARV